MPQPESNYPKEDTQARFLSKEGRYKEILCPPFCSSCTWILSSGPCLPQRYSIENLASHNIPETDTISNGCFADDLLCLTQRLCNLHIQADSRYADWAALQVLGKKAKLIGTRHKAKQTGIYGTEVNI